MNETQFERATKILGRKGHNVPLELQPHARVHQALLAAENTFERERDNIQLKEDQAAEIREFIVQAEAEMVGAVCDHHPDLVETHGGDVLPDRRIEDDTAILAIEAIDHMLRWKRGGHVPDHALSEDALERARDDLRDRLHRDE